MDMSTTDQCPAWLTYASCLFLHYAYRLKGIQSMWMPMSHIALSKILVISIALHPVIISYKNYVLGQYSLLELVSMI